MRRPISIFLTILFLHYIAGYFVVFWLLREQADIEMIQRLNSDNYSDSETVTFKLPFSIPYHKDWQAFERVDGEFQHHGEYFKLVKQKLERDTLYIVCIRDYKEKQIKGLATDFVKLSNDMTTGSKMIKMAGNYTRDYVASRINGYAIQPGYPENTVMEHAEFSLSKIYLSTPTPPPEA